MENCKSYCFNRCKIISPKENLYYFFKINIAYIFNKFFTNLLQPPLQRFSKDAVQNRMVT